MVTVTPKSIVCCRKGCEVRWGTDVAEAWVIFTPQHRLKTIMTPHRLNTKMTAAKGSFINYVTPFWPKIDPLPPPSVTPKRPFYPTI